MSAQNTPSPEEIYLAIQKIEALNPNKEEARAIIESFKPKKVERADDKNQGNTSSG